MKVYVIDAYDRFCPENNDGDWIQCIFSTKELAEAYCKKHDPPNKNPFMLKSTGLTILEVTLDSGTME